MGQAITRQHLFVLYIFYSLKTSMSVWTVEFSCWLILLRPSVRCCWLFWPLTLVTQSGERNLPFIMLVALRNLRVERGNCIVKRTVHEYNVVFAATVLFVAHKYDFYVHVFKNELCTKVGGLPILLLLLQFGWLRITLNRKPGGVEHSR